MVRSLYKKIFGLIGAIAITSPAIAQSDFEQFNDPVRVYVGGFWPEMSSELAINGDTLPPIPPIDVEDILGVEDSKGVAWGGIAWHFAERHAVELEYFSLNRDGGKSGTYSPPLQVEDTFIESGSIDTFYDTSLSRLTYGFSISRSERSDFQIKAGLHIAKLEAGLQLSGQICDPTTIPTSPPGCPTAGTKVASENVTAPLPHLGASFAYAMTPSLALHVQAIGFAIEIDSNDGSIIEIDADVAWTPFRNIGFGAGIRYFNTNIKSAGSDLNGEFNFEYFGPMVYISATF